MSHIDVRKRPKDAAGPLWLSYLVSLKSMSLHKSAATGSVEFDRLHWRAKLPLSCKLP